MRLATVQSVTRLATLPVPAPRCAALVYGRPCTHRGTIRIAGKLYCLKHA